MLFQRVELRQGTRLHPKSHRQLPREWYWSLVLKIDKGMETGRKVVQGCCGQQAASRKTYDWGDVGGGRTWMQSVNTDQQGSEEKASSPQGQPLANPG